MPQEPKKRHSRARQGKRRAHITFSPPTSVICANCKAVTILHVVCASCGFYRGKQVITVKKKHENAA